MLNSLKLTILVVSFVLFATFGWQNRLALASQSGPAAQLTGAPGEFDCSSSGCHTGGGVNSGNGTLAVTGLPAAYRPNQEIDLTVTLSQTNRARFGFELTAIDDQGRKAGQLIVTDSARTQKDIGFVGVGQREYILHTFNGTIPNGTNQGSWTMRWKAPAQTVGRVTFYVAGNAGNGNGAQTGDFIYTTSASMEAGAVLPNVTSVSAASFAAGALASETITAAFGIGLSQNVVVATGPLPLPTELDNTQVVVRDAFNIERNAPLFFVSPAQINYLVPQGVFPGAATVTVRRNGSDVAQGAITIETAAPALFAANANGQGVAAAVVLRVRDSQQLYEAVSRPEGGSQVPTPIDLGPETDQVYLLLFGTGFRNSISGVSVMVGGTNLPVPGYAAVAGFAGLDQCNVGPLPRSFAGRGNVNIVLTAGTKTANIVSVSIK
ncbi:MAG: choice-of-anchor V domain-containing protein [Acidobacteriota bacterium]